MIAMHREIMFIILMWRTEATEKTLSHGGKEGGKMEAGLLKKKNTWGGGRSHGVLS